MTASVISGGRSLRQEDVLARGSRAATGLSELGVGPGDGVAVLMRNDFSFFEACLAARALSAFAVPINWHGSPAEVQYILEDSGAKALVAHADLLAKCKDIVPDGVRVFAVETPPEIRAAYGLSPAACALPEEYPVWGEWLEGFAPYAGEKKPTSTMLYTSGTTGFPKGVRKEPMTPEQEGAVIANIGRVFGLTQGVRTIIPAPMYHAAPNAFALYTTLLNCTAVLQPRFDAEQFLGLVQEHKISHVQMVPTMFVRLLKLPDAVKARYDLSSLKYIIHAAAPCPPDVKRAMIDWLGPIVAEYYGSTESGVTTYCTSGEWQARPGTVGRANEFVTLKILDDAGNELGPGEIGNVYFRNAVMPEFTYHRKDDKRREIEMNGLITTGDIGYLDEEGYLFLCDRKVDMVISGGVNIYPAEIEAVLIQHPEVQDCAVFGIPDDEFGESLMAVVQPADGREPAKADLQDYLQERLAAFKVPKAMEFRASLPREDSGKIFKRKIRDEFWSDSGRSI